MARHTSNLSPLVNLDRFLHNRLMKTGVEPLLPELWQWVQRVILAGVFVASGLMTSPVQGAETERLYLSGAGKDDTVAWEFKCTYGAQSGYWTNIPVPSQWEAQGFGQASYQTDHTNASNELGIYRRSFKISRKFSKSRVFLVFEGVMTDTHVEINGRTAGPDHQGGFYRFKYDVTSLVQIGGRNQMEVTVRKRSANASINQAERQGDYWLFGGIFRPVYLEIVPQEFIDRVAIDARADGDFRMLVFAGGIATAASDLRVEAAITDGRGRAIGNPISGTVAAGTATLSARFHSPRPWTAETPELHRAVVSLKRGKQVVHRFEQRFGFRTIEVREGDGIYVNSQRVVLKGANRHSFWPDSGRCLSRDVHLQDIQLMKEMNLNAVRMSHYPPDSEFLDLCDEMGLYVLDELAGWHWPYDTATATRLVEQMVKRDVNHPSVLFWDNGNEGGWNTNVDLEFPKWDPQGRRVLHPWTTFGGINTAHYLNYDRAKAACEGVPTLRRWDYTDQQIKTNLPPTIYLPTEFLHGLYDGGAGAGLEDYWHIMSQSKLLGGGFIWALVDEGFRQPSTGLIDVAGNRAPDGILGPYRQKEASFYTVKEMWSPVTARLIGEPGAQCTFEIENHYSFTSTEDCRFTVQLQKFASPDDAQEIFKTADSRRVRSPSIPPGSKGQLRINLPHEARHSDAIALRIEDASGLELWTYVWPLAGADRLRSQLAISRIAAARTTEREDCLELKAGKTMLRVSKTTGLLAGISRGRSTLSLANGPRPAPGSFQLKTVRLTQERGAPAITAEFEGALEQVRWQLLPGDWIACSYSYQAAGRQDFLGVIFDYPETQVRSKAWLGDGPYRVWKNRLRGTTFNTWRTSFNRTITGWSDWVYPEFKGFFANVRWLKLNTTEGHLIAVPASEHQYVQVFAPDLPPKDLLMKTETKLPPSGLGFMDGIPAIGSKFTSAKDSGPQGEQNLAGGRHSGTIYLKFIPD